LDVAPRPPTPPLFPYTTLFRSGHADYSYLQKYGLRDPRGGGRASARLTAPMVAAGAVAKKWLAQKYGTIFRGCMQQIGDIAIPLDRKSTRLNSSHVAISYAVFC